MNCVFVKSFFDTFLTYGQLLCTTALLIPWLLPITTIEVAHAFPNCCPQNTKLKTINEI